MAKLTLSIDRSVVARAKRYASKRGVSVSQLVESYLDVLSESPATPEDPPILRSLRGSLKKANPDDYRRYLAKKYR